MSQLRWFLLFALIVTAVVPSLARAEARGPGGSGGGDAYASEFVSDAYLLLQRLASRPIEDIDHQALAGWIVKAKVSSAERLFLNGVEVDAINHRDPNQPRIQVSRKAWDRLKKDEFRRHVLVLHEYLGLMGVDDSRYQVSRLLDEAQVCSRSEPFRKALERKVGISCSRIIPEDLLKIRGLNVDGAVQLQPSDFHLLDNLRQLGLEGGVEEEKDNEQDEPICDYPQNNAPGSNDDVPIPDEPPVIVEDPPSNNEPIADEPPPGECEHENNENRPPTVLKSIPPKVFSSLRKLERISIGTRVEVVEPYAFSDLPRLSEVEFDRVGDIQANAFNGAKLERLETLRAGTLRRNAFSGATIETFALNQDPDWYYQVADPVDIEDGAFAGSKVIEIIFHKAYVAKATDDTFSGGDLSRAALDLRAHTQKTFEPFRGASGMWLQVDFLKSPVSALDVFENIEKLTLQASGMELLPEGFFAKLVKLKKVKIEAHDENHSTAPLPLRLVEELKSLGFQCDTAETGYEPANYVFKADCEKKPAPGR